MITGLHAQHALSLIVAKIQMFAWNVMIEDISVKAVVEAIFVILIILVSVVGLGYLVEAIFVILIILVSVVGLGYLVEAIFVILIILVSVVGLGYSAGVLFESVFEDEDYMTGNYPKITFKLFTEMYAISPNKWEFHDTHVRYQSRIIVFKTKRDYRKYKKFKEKEETRKREVERLKEEAKIAKCFQDDIDRYRAETMKK